MKEKNKDQGRQQELYTRLVKAGTRSYYIDAKKDSAGSHYIVLCERRQSDRPGGERQRVFVYEEDLDKFTAALLDVIKFVRSGVSDSTSGEMEGSDRLRLEELDELNLDEFIGKEGDWE